jgi:hypothetical protein
MLSRIGTPTRTTPHSAAPVDLGNAEDDSSFGLKNNPLTQFAVAFGALVHDADHPGGKIWTRRPG